MNLLLLGTDHCTLCELAMELLLSMPELRGCTLETVDVADDEALAERYGARLPVLLVAGRELDWPFTPAQVSAALGIA